MECRARRANSFLSSLTASSALGLGRLGRLQRLRLRSASVGFLSLVGSPVPGASVGGFMSYPNLNFTTYKLTVRGEFKRDNLLLGRNRRNFKYFAVPSINLKKLPPKSGFLEWKNGRSISEDYPGSWIGYLKKKLLHVITIAWAFPKAFPLFSRTLTFCPQCSARVEWAFPLAGPKTYT